MRLVMLPPARALPASLPLALDLALNLNLSLNPALPRHREIEIEIEIKSKSKIKSKIEITTRCCGRRAPAKVLGVTPHLLFRLQGDEVASFELEHPVHTPGEIARMSYNDQSDTLLMVQLE